MRHLKITMLMAAALILNVLVALTGCGEDHGNRIVIERDRPPERVEQRDNDRHDNDRHEDRGHDSGHDHDEHGER